MSEELKPCPMCGEAAKLVHDSGNEVWPQGWRVACSSCWMSGPKVHGSSSWRVVKNEDQQATNKAITAWNRRAPLAKD